MWKIVYFILLFAIISIDAKEAVQKLLTKINSLSPEPRRKVSAVVGAVVADAASRPLQWIYNIKDIQNIVRDENPEFWPTSENPYYTIPLGSSSSYIDGLISSLSNIAVDHRVNVNNIANDIEQKFGSSDSPYQEALVKRKQGQKPVLGPWINSCMIKSLDNMKNGTSPPGSRSCHDNDGFMLSLPAALLDLDMDTADQVARILTNDTATLTYIRIQNIAVANIVKKQNVTANEKGDGDLQNEYSGIGRVFQVLTEDAGYNISNPSQNKPSLSDIIKYYGQSCKLPGAFQAGLAAYYLYPDYKSAVRGNILAGGDSCGRAAFIGAVRAAQDGLDTVPLDWIESVQDIEQIIDNAISAYSKKEIQSRKGKDLLVNR